MGLTEWLRRALLDLIENASVILAYSATTERIPLRFWKERAEASTRVINQSHDQNLWYLYPICSYSNPNVGPARTYSQYYLFTVPVVGICKSYHLLSCFTPEIHCHGLPTGLNISQSIMEGHCQCGQIRFTTPEPKPSAVYFCYCNECRHQSSSAHGISAIFPAFGITPPYEGALSVYTRKKLNGRTLDCLFCSRCGSRLMHKAQGEKMVAVKGGCLDGLNVSHAVHIWCKEAIVPIPDGIERFEEEPS